MKQKSISFLLGAGFSIPMGYPSGSQLNDLILNAKGYSISPSGELNEGPWLLKSPYCDYWDFYLFVLETYQSQHKDFDYEIFYDYICYGINRDPLIEQYFYDINEFEKKHKIVDFISQIKIIYNQIIEFKLKDRNGINHYDAAPYIVKRNGFPGYTGFLNCLEELKENFVINVHTLNHDLLFERFNKTEWLHEDICDGFTLRNSHYIGKDCRCGESKEVPLEYYNEEYNKNIRLYKLHGSLDYYMFHETKGCDIVRDKCIKKRGGISEMELYKKGENNVNVSAAPINYVPLFLTGKKAKERDYNSEPFKTLQKCFIANIRNADLLIVIGYGCKDDAINQIVYENFDVSKPAFIVNPNMDEKTNLFMNTIKGKHVRTKIEDLSLKDFQM